MKLFEDLPSTNGPITAEMLNQIQDNLVVVSATEPTGDNREKVWIQNTDTEQKMYLLNDNNVYEEVINTKLEQKVDKVSGKGLSTNDFTSAYKTKLDGIATGATKNTVENSLTSTSTTNALSANQGKILNERIIGTILYKDETGTAGDVSLSNNIINYSSFKVYGYYIHEGNTTIKTKFSKEFEVNSISDIIDLSGVVYSGESYTYFIEENASVTGSTITRGTKWKNAFGVKEDSGSWRENGEYVYITKVIGYE